VSTVAYKLEIGGQRASKELLDAVQSLEVEEHADLADMVRLRVNVAQRDDGGGWTLLDEGIFSRLANLKVAAAVDGGRPEPLIDAYVVDVRVALSHEPGASRVDVVAMDATALMNLEEKVRSWPDQSDSSVASTIFGEYGFTTDVEDTSAVRQEAEHTTMQRGTDMQLLKQLAQRNGYECYVEVTGSGGTAGHFHRPRLDEQPQGVLNVGMGPASNVDAFSARNDMLGPTTAAVQGVETTSTDAQPADSSSVEGTALGSTPTVGGDRPRKVLLSGTGLSDAGDLQTLAQAVVDRSSWAVTAEGRVNGAVYGGAIKAKRPINVRGAGAELSGTYYVELVLHTFTSEGWIQSFRLRRNAAGLTKSESFKEDRAAAPQPAARVGP
jgi:phage protein D